MPPQTRRASRRKGDATAYPRLQRLRRNRKALGWQVFELWLPPEDAARLMALKQPGETLTAVIGRALRSLQGHEARAPVVAPTPQARKAGLVARLQQMKAAGMTYHAMARQLDAEGVPTLSGRGLWIAGTIGNLLAQAKEKAP